MYRTRTPCFIWGPPGIGKSDIVRQTAQGLNIGLRDIRAVLLDPVDLRGIPRINGDGTCHWATPDFWPREGAGIIFLDELNAAPPLVQAACYQLILDRRLGEYMVPPDWGIIAAGNRESDRAVTNRMPSALANRFAHVNLDVDLTDWCAWYLQDRTLPIEPLAFCRFRPHLLHAFDPKKSEKAFPTPRSWEKLARLFQVTPPALWLEVFSGIVGEGAAAEFTGFAKVFGTMPNPDAVLMSPDSAPVPDAKTAPATLYALCGALAARANEQNFDRLTRYAARLPVEFNVMLIRDVVKRSPAVQNTRAFINWAALNSNVFF